MLRYVGRRLLIMVPTVIVISMVVFFIIQLPPGDFMSSYIASMEASNEPFDMNTIARMRESYGLDKPWYVQYFRWVLGIFTRGDFGYSLDRKSVV